jgi:polyhydroxyalkanoate synthesis regulator phasin
MELSEGLKKIFLAGVGAVATTAETAKDVVDTLVKKGELTVDQGKVLNEELKQSTKTKVKEHVSVTVVKEFKDAMAAVNHMSSEELEELKEKIAKAEKSTKAEAADAPSEPAGEEQEDKGTEKPAEEKPDKETADPDNSFTGNSEN